LVLEADCAQERGDQLKQLNALRFYRAILAQRLIY